MDIFQRERLVAKLQHRSEAPGNTENKHTARKAFDKSGIPGVFFCPLQFIFACTIVKYCVVALCRNGSKKRPDLSYFCFATRPNEREKWKDFYKRTDKKFKTLGDPRICSLHFTSKESDIEISLFGQKLSVRSDCCPTIFDPAKSTNPGRIRLVHVRSVLPIKRDSVMNNVTEKPRKLAAKSSILRTP